MVAVPSTDSIDFWFLDIGATHHLAHTSINLSNNALYQSNDKVTINSGKQLPICHIGSKFFYTPHKTFQPQHVFQVPQLITNLVSVSKSALIIIQFLNLILFPLLLMTKLPRRSFFRVFLNVAYMDFPIPTMVPP